MPTITFCKDANFPACPSTGSGSRLVWKHMLALARVCQRQHVGPDDAASLIEVNVLANQDNAVRPDIRKDVLKAIAKVYNGHVVFTTTDNTPIDDGKIKQVLFDRCETLEYWQATSPVVFDDNDASAAAKVVGQLLPDELICVAIEPHDARVIKQGLPLSRFAYIVPSPMLAIAGGRTMDNVKERHYVVVEFDVKGPMWGELLKASGYTPHDAQARLISYITAQYWLPLTMIVDSGNTSLHAWFACHGRPEADTLAFLDFAIELGADKAARNVHQLFRMPHGTRDGKRRQRIIYFNNETPLF